MVIDRPEARWAARHGTSPAPFLGDNPQDRPNLIGSVRP